MSEEIVKILGIKVGHKKDNPEKQYFNYYYQKAFEEYEKDNSDFCSGVQCGSEFSTKAIDLQVGDVGSFTYRKGYGDKAYISGFDKVVLAK